MTFEEILDQALAMLQRRGRVTYRMLNRQFQLDDEALTDLKEALLRPEYQHGWGNKTYYTQLRLDPLPPASADELLQALLREDPGLASLKRLLIARTEGNPFFWRGVCAPCGRPGCSGC